MYIVWFMWIVFAVIMVWHIYGGALDNAIKREARAWDYEKRQRTKKKNEEEGKC